MTSPSTVQDAVDVILRELATQMRHEYPCLYDARGVPVGDKYGQGVCNGLALAWLVLRRDLDPNVSRCCREGQR